MPSISDHPARGKISKMSDGLVSFAPVNTNYVLHLRSADKTLSFPDHPVNVYIRVQARKVYTVPTGGNFVSPLFGSPRIIQGRVLYIEDKLIVVQAGATFVVQLPAADSAIDLDEGQITVGKMVNVVAQPDASLSISIGSATAGRPVLQKLR